MEGAQDTNTYSYLGESQPFPAQMQNNNNSFEMQMPPFSGAVYSRFGGAAQFGGGGDQVLEPGVQFDAFTELPMTSMPTSSLGMAHNFTNGGSSMASRQTTKRMKVSAGLSNAAQDAHIYQPHADLYRSSSPSTTHAAYASLTDAPNTRGSRGRKRKACDDETGRMDLPLINDGSKPRANEKKPAKATMKKASNTQPPPQPSAMSTSSTSNQTPAGQVASASNATKLATWRERSTQAALFSAGYSTAPSPYPDIDAALEELNKEQAPC